MTLWTTEYWLEWTKNYFRCQFTHMGGQIYKKNAPESTSLWIVAFWKFNRTLGGLTNAVSVFVNSINITTNIETVVLSSRTPSPKSHRGDKRDQANSPLCALPFFDIMIRYYALITLHHIEHNLQTLGANVCPGLTEIADTSRVGWV